MEVDMKRFIFPVIFSVLSTQPALADCRDICWGAIVAGTWNNFDGSAQGSSGTVSNYETEAEAIRRATASCQATGRNCEVVTTWTRGCGYISWGSNSNGDAKYGTSNSVSGALNKCRQGGFNCDAPSGACVAD